MKSVVCVCFALVVISFGMGFLYANKPKARPFDDAYYIATSRPSLRLQAFCEEAHQCVGVINLSLERIIPQGETCSGDLARNAAYQKTIRDISRSRFK